MTERDRAMERLAINMALVVQWLIDTAAPCLPRHIENCYRVIMHTAEELSAPENETDRKEAPK